MSADFVAYFKNEIDEVQTYAREHRQGNDKNRAELDRRISIMLRRFHPSIQRALATPSENPNVEARRQEHLKWKRIFLKFTSWIKILVIVLTTLLILAIGYYGSGSAGSQLAYKCYFAVAIAVFAAAGFVLYRFKKSTKEFLIENILVFSPD